MYLAVIITLLVGIAVLTTLHRLTSRRECEEVRVPVRIRAPRAGRRRY